MPQSLHRTWAALAIAALAVALVAVLAGRDFVRDVSAACPGRLQEQDITHRHGRDPVPSNATLDAVYLETIPKTPGAQPVRVTSSRVFHLVYDQRVRVYWKEPGGDAGCTCGSVALWPFGQNWDETPAGLKLFRVRGTDQYVVKSDVKGFSSSEVRAAFTIEPGARHHIQYDRIVTVRHLPLLVALCAIGALVVALFRSRRAMSYALRIHTWTPAQLTPGGCIEGDDGATLGALEQTRWRQVPPGPVLVAPEAISTGGLYRDVPIVARRHIAEGTHARWATGTMVRLRDARALAVIGTAAALLSFGARLIA